MLKTMWYLKRKASTVFGNVFNAVIKYRVILLQIFVAQDFDGNLLPDNVGIVMAGLTFIDKIFGFNYLRTKKEPEMFLTQFTNNYR